MKQGVEYVVVSDARAFFDTRVERPNVGNVWATRGLPHEGFMC